MSLLKLGRSDRPGPSYIALYDHLTADAGQPSWNDRLALWHSPMDKASKFALDLYGMEHRSPHVRSFPFLFMPMMFSCHFLSVHVQIHNLCP